MLSRLSPTKSSSTIARASPKRAAATREPRSPSRRKFVAAARALLAVEEDELDAVARAPDRPRKLGHHRCARRAVVGADEAVDVLGVVVGAHHDVAGLAPVHGPDHVAKAARNLLVAPARQPLAQRPCQLPRGVRTGGPGTQLDLRAQQPPGRGGVEAVDGRGARFGVFAVGERDVVGRHEHDQRQAEHHLHRKHGSEKLHQLDCGG